MSLAELKTQLWELAAKEPFFGELEEPEQYLLEGISAPRAEEEDFYDESVKFGSLQLLLPLLRLEKLADDAAAALENMRNAMIAK